MRLLILRLSWSVLSAVLCSALAQYPQTPSVEAVAFGDLGYLLEEDRVSSHGDPVDASWEALADPCLAAVHAASGYLGGKCWNYSGTYRFVGGDASWKGMYRLAAADPVSAGTWLNLQFDLVCSGRISTWAQGVHDGDNWAFSYASAGAGFAASAIHGGSVAGSVSFDGRAYRDDYYYRDGEYGVLFWEGQGAWNGFFDGSLIHATASLILPAQVDDLICFSATMSILSKADVGGYLASAGADSRLDFGFSLSGATDMEGNPVGVSFMEIPEPEDGWVVVPVMLSIGAFLHRALNGRVRRR